MLRKYLILLLHSVIAYKHYIVVLILTGLFILAMSDLILIY